MSKYLITFELLAAKNSSLNSTHTTIIEEDPVQWWQNKKYMEYSGYWRGCIIQSIYKQETE